MKIALNKCEFGIFLRSQLCAMNAAAPEGTPPRRVNNREHSGKHGTAPHCRTEALRRGALTSAFFMVLVRTLVHARFYKSRKSKNVLDMRFGESPEERNTHSLTVVLIFYQRNCSSGKNFIISGISEAGAAESPGRSPGGRQGACR